uniref:Uncharacterized protein n=1 Tax=Arundo donax TaxID=35708 RepID=A0A0A9E020_ARUDO
MKSFTPSNIHALTYVSKNWSFGWVSLLSVYSVILLLLIQNFPAL